MNKSTYGDNAARRLLERGKVLPILDGIDEIIEPYRRGAMPAIKESPFPWPGLIITCRAEEYASAEAEGNTLAGAEIVNLEPVQTNDVIEFLQATSPQGPWRERWEPVFERLKDDPESH